MNDHGLQADGVQRHARVEPPLGHISVPVVAERGALPDRDGSRRQLDLPRDPYDQRAEKIRALRTELMLRQEEEPGANFIALLSPQAGEGRSKLAAELAVAFAQLGRPTLLVDADLRRPVQHSLFGLSNRQGLSQAISGSADACIHATSQFRNLSLLPAGPPPSNPVELLSARRFRDLADGWRAQYDFVIVDTPPVTHYSDGLTVAAVARRVLLLNRADHTPYREVSDLLRRLSATQSQIVGAVINRF